MNLLFFLAICTWHVASSVQTTGTQLPGNAHQKLKDPAGEISEIQMGFALQLYKATADVKTGFFAVSASDVFLILSQLYYGAQGLSQQQLSNVLHYTPDQNAERGIQDLVTRQEILFLNNVPTYNRIFHAYEWNLEKSFIKKTRSVFHTAPSKVSWDMLTSGNAIYEWAKSERIIHPYIQRFKGQESLVLAIGAEFSKNFVLNSYNTKTFRSPFYYNANAFIGNCRYLGLTPKLNYGELKYGRESINPEAKYIGLTWKINGAQDIKTFFILPNERDGIDKLEKNIDETMVHAILSNEVLHWVSATLPEDIAIDSAGDLTESLKNMNLTAMFEETIDFAKISGTHAIKVGPVLQQVKVHHKWAWANKWDDEFSSDLKIFNADHAFIILTVLMDKHPFILYMGRHGWKAGVTDGETGVVL